MKYKHIDHLKMLAETDFQGACVWADNNVPELKEFFDTWARHCGASRDVFIGHTIKMIVSEPPLNELNKG